MMNDGDIDDNICIWVQRDGDSGGNVDWDNNEHLNDVLWWWLWWRSNDNNYGEDNVMVIYMVINGDGVWSVIKNSDPW